MTNGGWGWGAAFVDFDNNGFLDIIMTSGKRSFKYAYMFLKGRFLGLIFLLLVSNSPITTFPYQVSIFRRQQQTIIFE